MALVSDKNLSETGVIGSEITVLTNVLKLFKSNEGYADCHTVDNISFELTELKSLGDDLTDTE